MIQIFLHQKSRTTDMVQVNPHRTVEDFATECAGKGAFLWLEDATEPTKPEMSLCDVGVTELCHVHISLCSIVQVKVRYAGDTRECSLSPASTVGEVHKWVASPQGFKLTDTESAKHELAICGEDTSLDRAEHIGSYVDENCSVCLDLLPKERFAGRTLQ